MSEILAIVMNLSAHVFAITRVLATGLRLTAKSITGPSRGMPGLVKRV